MFCHEKGSMGGPGRVWAPVSQLATGMNSYQTSVQSNELLNKALQCFIMIIDDENVKLFSAIFLRDMHSNFKKRYCKNSLDATGVFERQSSSYGASELKLTTCEQLL